MRRQVTLVQGLSIAFSKQLPEAVFQATADTPEEASAEYERHKAEVRARDDGGVPWQQ